MDIQDIGRILSRGQIKMDLCNDNNLIFVNDIDGFHILDIQNKSNPLPYGNPVKYNEKTTGFPL